MSGEDGLDRVPDGDMPCDRQHASALQQTARTMHSGMVTPVDEVHSTLSEQLASDGFVKEGFTLSEVVSTVVAHDSGSAAPASVRLERLEDDDDEGHVSFVVTARAAAADGDQQILQRTVRVSTPVPSRPKRNVKPIQRYSPSGSAMSRQTLTEISEAKLDEETSMVSADVSARTPDETFDTPRSEPSQAAAPSVPCARLERSSFCPAPTL